MKDMIEETIEAELDEELGYSKYDYRTKENTNLFAILITATFT
jgi:hypothetical protein